MPRQPVIPTNVTTYGQMAPHLPAEQYHAAPACTCSHGHGAAPATVQNITIKQSDPWIRYMAMGFAGAGISLMVFASIVATLIAAGMCALCVAVAAWAVRALVSSRSEGKKS
ncbi:hypothetical protein ACGFR8_31525 [Streptomyces brevispora]|uniref:hypothetical protein n=1 Tax=Streptomyces brevispora TaxID=887462 RepID=UPI00371AB84A